MALWSHLIFPRKRLPLDQAVSFTHPEDHRPLYAMPWQGVTLVGTTDLDHEFPLSDEPRISRGEGRYLLEGLKHCFPAARLEAGDVTATFAGVRPVLNTGKTDPSKEARDHVVWSRKGLVTVTGGKLTTFALLARETLGEIVKWSGGPTGRTGLEGEKEQHLYAGRLAESAAEKAVMLLLSGRYGSDARAVFLRARYEGWERVADTDLFWGEVLFSAGYEQVVHLEDLMLRRTRLGLLLPAGGKHILAQSRERLLPVLGWDGHRWEEEEASYLALWDEAYNPDFLLN